MLTGGISSDSKGGNRRCGFARMKGFSLWKIDVETGVYQKVKAMVELR